MPLEVKPLKTENDYLYKQLDDMDEALETNGKQ